jgi:hypothetical protein
VTGTITQLHVSRGVGALLGEDGKRYTFRRSDVREVWFHDLTEGGRVAFEPAKLHALPPITVDAPLGEAHHATVEDAHALGESRRQMSCGTITTMAIRAHVP